MLKYQVSYKKPKKKGYACHKAVFYKIEDAIFWEEHVKKNLNAVDTQITVHYLPQTTNSVYINRVKQMNYDETTKFSSQN